MSKVRLRKGRDAYQQGTWTRNKEAIKEFFRSHPGEEFTLDELSTTLKLSRTAIRSHLCFFLATGMVERDERERPAKYGLRPFWPMPLALVGKIQETLTYASESWVSLPDTVTFPLDEKREVTISRRGKEYARFYSLTLREAAAGFKERVTVA